jgi:hypothetical protein
MSRESGHQFDTNLLCMQNLVYAITVLAAMPNMFVDRIIVLHISNWSMYSTLPQSSLSDNHRLNKDHSRPARSKYYYHYGHETLPRGCHGVPGRI